MKQGKSTHTLLMEMEEKAALLQHITDNMFDLVALTDPRGNFTYLGKSHEKLGYELDDLKGKNVMDLVYPEDQPTVMENFQTFLNHREDGRILEYRILCQDGSYLWLETMGKILTDEAGNIKELLFSSRDITQQKQEKEMLERIMTASRRFLETTTLIDPWVLAEDMRLLTGAAYVAYNRFNENEQGFTTVAFTGAAAEIEKAVSFLGFKIVGKEWPHDPVRAEKTREKSITAFDSLEMLMGKRIPTQLLRSLEKTFNLGQVYIVKIKKQDNVMGDFTLMMKQGEALNNPEMATLYASQVGLFLDRAKQEQDLRTERQRLADIIEGTHVGTWEWNVQTGETEFNEKWAEMVGYTLEELEPTNINTWASFAHPDDLMASNDQLQEVFERKREYYDIECRMKHRDGHWIWVYDRGKVISWTDDGKPLTMSGTHTNINKRKQAEAQAAVRQQELDIYFTSSLDLLCIANTKGEFIRLNPEWEAVLGYPLNELEGKIFLDYVHPEDQTLTLEAVEKLKKQQAVTGFTNRYRCKDGSYRWIEWRTKPVGQVIYAVARDITERMREQEALLIRDQLMTKLSQQVPGAIYQYQLRPDGSARFPYASEGITQVFGVTPEEVVEDASVIFSRVHPDDLDRFASSIQISADTQKIWHEEYRVILPEGGLRWLQGIARPEKLADGSVLWHGYIADVTDRKHMEEQLKEREFRLKIATEGANTGIWDWNMVTNEVVFSVQWKKMLGYEDHEIENAFFGWKKLWHPEDAANIEQAIEDHLAGKTENYEIIHRCRHKDGDWRWIVTRGTLLKDSSNTPYRWVGTNVDITELKKAEKQLLGFTQLLEVKNQELDMAAQQAEAANQAKSQFLASMSHEIRTPMNGILGFLQLLEETRVEPQQARYISYIKTSTDTLLTLLNDILDLSKIESGKMALEQISFELGSTLEDAVITQAHRAQSKGLELHLKLYPGLPRQVKGDPIRLRQILTNLVSNAVKFTEKGSVTVACYEVDQMEGISNIAIAVTDTGIGIPEVAQETLFEVFTQADTSTTREYGGSGLGLAITRDLVKLMRGSIEVESTLGKGSTFTITLPLEIDTTARRKATPAHIPQKTYDNKGLKVLVVEDQHVNQALVVQLLQNRGIRCDIAENGQQAVEACRKETYHLVLMDIQMPVMDGTEATRQIRALTGIKQPLIAAMTAHAMNEDEARCLAAGMDAYLTKPIDVRQVSELLQLGMTRAEEVAGESNAHSPVLSSEIIQEMMKKTGFDQATAEEMLAEGLDSWQELLTLAEEALVHKDWEKLKHFMHNIKGSAANLRVVKLAELANEGIIQTAEKDKVKIAELLTEIRTVISQVRGR